MDKSRLLEYMTVSQIHKNKIMKQSILILLLMAFVGQPIILHLLGQFTYLKMFTSMITLEFAVVYITPMIITLIVFVYIKVKQTTKQLDDEYKDRSEIRKSQNELVKMVRKRNDNFTSLKKQKIKEDIFKGTYRLFYQGVALLALFLGTYDVFRGSMPLNIKLFSIAFMVLVFVIWFSHKRFKEVYNEFSEYIDDLKWYINKENTQKEK